MPKKIGQKARWRNNKNKPRRKGFIRCLCLAGMTLMVNLLMPAMMIVQKVEAVGCPDIKIIFARGSGEERWEDQNFLAFRSALSEKLELTELTYDFLDLDYPAIDVGNIWTLLTTFVGRGEAYEFGASINKGVQLLTKEVNSSACPNTKFVVAGYSQGAMVVSKAAQFLDSDKLIYAATFGDPKIYLPEGFGAMPEACRGANLSNYRIYVPDCRAYEGMLGSYRPYQPDTLIDKMGTWCNSMDIFCSSYLSVKSHTSYVADGLYEDASKLIFDKITQAFGIENDFVSLHDTAILIDSTGSMSSLIDKYKSEALRLAEKTLANRGRVALYDYRDINDGYEPKERCNFNTCTLEAFKAGLDAIDANGGGDKPESLLSAGLHVMKKLDWNYGSTKSVVVLTDADYHNPDLDGTTFDDVVKLSKSIDPVNFYFVVPASEMAYYESLAVATDGKVVASTGDLSILTDTIISRYDSLPRVDELSDDTEELPEILDASFETLSDSSVRVSWESTNGKVMIALNDYILGVVEGDFVVIDELDPAQEHIVTLIPLTESRRGRGISLEITIPEAGGLGGLRIPEDNRTDVVRIPKVPNTGRR